MHTLTIHKLCTRCGHEFDRETIQLQKSMVDEDSTMLAGTCPMCMEMLVKRVYWRGYLDSKNDDVTAIPDLMNDGSVPVGREHGARN